jgi:hypothetical protein
VRGCFVELHSAEPSMDVRALCFACVCVFSAMIYSFD